MIGTQGESRLRKGRGKLVNRGLKYPKVFIYIPSHVMHDSNFPFKIGDHVTIEIGKDELIIKKLKDSGKPK